MTSSGEKMAAVNEALAPETGAALLMERIVRAAYEDRHSTAIQPLQWSILRYLNDATMVERDITSIAAHLGLTAAPVSRAITSLEKRGLIRRGPHPKSKRAVAVTIEPNGLAKLRDDPILRVALMIHELPKDERSAFIRTLGRLSLKFL